MGQAAVTEEHIRSWHEELLEYLKEENVADILEESERISNSDESGFMTNSKTGLILGPKGMKDLYEIKTGSEKESITVLVTINAKGKILPPMIIYPYERVPSDIVRNMNPEWVAGRSKSGWMTGQAFYRYICYTFLPLLRKNNVVSCVVSHGRALISSNVQCVQVLC